MKKIKLYKKYADGQVRGVEINDTPANIRHMMSHDFFLTEEEATAGEVMEPTKAPAAPEPAAATKPAAKKK